MTTRTVAVCFALAGVLFAAYPAARPYSDEASLAGAKAVGSNAWIVAHLLAVASFVLFGLALLGLRDLARTAETPPARGSRTATTACLLGWVGTGLVLPYYGAEVFGLYAIAGRALVNRDVTLLALFTEVRYQPAAGAMFLVGLTALAAAGVAAALAVARSGLAPAWAGWPLAAGLVLILPQFFTPPPLRAAHGILVGVGGLLLAGAMHYRSSTGRNMPSNDTQVTSKA